MINCPNCETLTTLDDTCPTCGIIPRNYKKDNMESMRPELEKAFVEYCSACYGDRLLDPTQLKEVRQAFYSGMHWLNSKSACPSDQLNETLRSILLPRDHR